MKRLPERLKAIAKPVIPGQVVVDVGTDHAYLPIFLVQQQISPRVIGVEVNPGPLRSAVLQVESAGLAPWIDIRAGNGLQAVQPGEAQIAVIAGMGGKTICEILEASPVVTATLNRLILQPIGAIMRVRAWLRQNLWQIVEEELLLEDGHFYLILVAEPQPTEDPALLALNNREVQETVGLGQVGEPEEIEASKRLEQTRERGQTKGIKKLEQTGKIEKSKETKGLMQTGEPGQFIGTEEPRGSELEELAELEVGTFLLQRRHPLLAQYLTQQLEREQRIWNLLSRGTDPRLEAKREKRRQRIKLFTEMIDQLEE